MKQRITALLLAALMVLGMTACASDNSSDSTAANASQNTSESTDSTESKTEKKVIGVMQYMQHDALDAAYQGFQAALEDNGYADQVEYLYENAQGDSNTLNTISDRFISDEVDLVLAIATPAAQTIAGKTTEIPILATAVTSFTEAKLVDSDENPGHNVSGTSDMNPVAEQIALLKELVPDCETVGFLYASNETNSVLQIKLAKEACDNLNLKYEEVTVTSTNDVQQAAQSLVGKCDAIYIPTDNVTAASMPIVSGVTEPEKIVTVCGEAGMVHSGGLVTMGLSYYDLGYQTGLMAIEVLFNGADVSTMPVQYAAASDDITFNGEYAAAIGFEIPEKYQECIIYPSQEE